MIGKNIVAALILVFFGCNQIFASTLPEGFIELLVAENLDPTKMIVVPDGRLFIAEKNGKILVVKDDILSDQLFLDIDVDNFNERGLSGFALDPNYEINNYFYVYYTVAGKNYNRLSRFTANGDSALPNSEVILMEFDPLCSTVHNGGEMHFGPDGKLYVATGDGSCGILAQNLDSFHGKMIRLNTDGSIPEDNPFYTQNEGNYRAIFATGFRNPFTFDIQQSTGRIFVNDVGNSNWEEINQVISGGNYGWAVNEGPSTVNNPENYVAPIYAYDHDAGCAIVGGTFYNPEIVQFPEEYVGKYFFGDYCRGYIKVLDPDTGEVVETFAEEINRGVSIVTAPNGSIYYIERAGIGDGSQQDNMSSTNGRLWKISYTGSGAPFISIQPKSQLIPVGESVDFSVQTVGADLSYQWMENDIKIAGANTAYLSIVNVSLDLDQNEYSCVIINDLGEVTTTKAILTVTSNQRPIPMILQPLSDMNYKGGDVIDFVGAATDIEDGTVVDDGLSWYIDFHHDEHTHPGLESAIGVSGSYMIPKVGETSPNVWYRIHLTATDSEGLSGTSFIDIFPKKTQVTVTSDPSGIPIRVDGTMAETPFSFESVVGINRYIQAPPFVENGDDLLIFDKWSDGLESPIYFYEASEEALNLDFKMFNASKGNGNGLKGEYFQREADEQDSIWSFIGVPELVRVDTMIDFLWEEGIPGEGVGVDNFTVRWTGYIEPIYTDIYNMAIFTDDGGRLWIDDELIIDQWQYQGPTFKSGDVFMEIGRKYSIRMEYFEAGGGATCQLYWGTQSLNSELVPQSNLYTDATSTTAPEVSSKVHVYPQPAREEINILLNNDVDDKGEYSILDMSGALVLNSVFTKTSKKLEITVDTSELPQGIYLITFDGEKFKESYKFVKI